MKVLVLFMALCIAVFPVMAGNINSMQKSLKDKFCHEMARGSACTHTKKNVCDPVACHSMNGCISTTFYKTEALTLAPFFPSFIGKVPVPEYIGELSQYTSFSWRPPAV